MPETRGGKLGTLGRQAAQGLTFGFVDEAADPIAAALASAITGQKYSDMLSQARQNSQEELGQDWQENPVTSFAGQVAGSVPFGFTKAAGSLANWASNGTRLARALKGSAVGAGYGAASGLGAGDDTLAGRAGSAITGTAIGGLLGGASGALSRGKPTPEAMANQSIKSAEKLASNKAEKALMQDLAMRPDLPDVLKRVEGMSQASKQSGIPLTLAEMVAQSSSDPLLARQGILKSSPMTAGEIDKFYNARLGTPQQQGSIEAALLSQAQQYGGTGSYDDVAQALIAKAKEATGNITKKLVNESEPYYTKAFSKKVNPNELKSILNSDPVAARYLEQAMSASDPSLLKQVAGQTQNSVAAIDAAKRLIDKSMAGFGSDAPANPRALREAKDALVSLADQYAPSYQKARGVYSGQPDQLSMRSQIGSLADVDPLNAKSVVQNLYKGTPANAKLSAQALGPDANKAIAAKIYNSMDTLRNPTDPATGQVTQLANRIAPDAQTLEMLKAYGANPELLKTLEVINQAKLGDRFVNNSPTQSLQNAASGMETAANLAGTALDVATSGKTALLKKAASFLGKGGPETDPQFYKDMAELMLTDKGVDLVRRAAQGQQNALTEINQISVPAKALAGAKNALIGRPTMQATIGGVMAPNAPMVTVNPNSGMTGTPPMVNLPEGAVLDALPEGAVLDQQVDLPEGAVLDTGPQSSASPVGLLDRIAQVESGGNPNAQAKTSSASGLYQFTDKTWADTVAKYGQKYGITPDMKSNPQAQRLMAQELAQENASHITKMTGKQPTDGDIYLAHFMGAPAASKLITSLGTGASAARMFPSAAKANQTIFFNPQGRPRTVDEVYKIVTRKVEA